MLTVLVALALIVAAATALRAWVGQVYTVPSASMAGTVRPGEKVAVERVSYWNRAPERGEVVVFDGRGLFADPGSGDLMFVKRVIGVGGDRVACCDESGHLTVNGAALDESSYLDAGDQPSEVRFDVEVPPGSMWVMGDHRSASADSRRYIGSPGGGFIPLRRVAGRVVGVVWPLSSARRIETPGTFAQAATAQP